jgi:hypothetical protein
MINWKGFGRMRSWPNFKVLSRHSPGGLWKSTKNLSQDRRSPGRDLNSGTPEYEVTTTFCRFSIEHSYKQSDYVGKSSERGCCTVMVAVINGEQLTGAAMKCYTTSSDSPQHHYPTCTVHTAHTSDCPLRGTQQNAC